METLVHSFVLLSLVFTLLACFAYLPLDVKFEQDGESENELHGLPGQAAV